MFSDFVSHNEQITLCPTAVHSSVWPLVKLATFHCFQEKQTFSYPSEKPGEYHTFLCHHQCMGMIYYIYNMMFCMSGGSTFAPCSTADAKEAAG